MLQEVLSGVGGKLVSCHTVLSYIGHDVLHGDILRLQWGPSYSLPRLAMPDLYLSLRHAGSGLKMAFHVWVGGIAAAICAVHLTSTGRAPPFNCCCRAACGCLYRVCVAQTSPAQPLECTVHYPCPASTFGFPRLVPMLTDLIGRSQMSLAGCVATTIDM